MRTLLILLGLLVLPSAALAQSDATAFVPLTSIPGIESAANAQTLPDFLNTLYKLAIGAAAVLAVLQIVRAGIVYMGGDSVTEKKEAKQLIVLSLGGLLLILSPVIVFSIINPDILSLKIGNLDELTQTTFDAYEPGQTIETGGGGQCSAYTALLAVSSNIGCSASQYTADGFEQVAATCCSGLTAGKVCCGSKTLKPAAAPAATTPQACQATYSLVQASNACSSSYVTADNACCSSVGAGQKCCGKKKTTTQATSTWGWRGRFQKGENGTPTTQQQGPFATQAQCNTSLQTWPAENGLVSTGEFSCTCQKSLAEQPGCSF